MLNSETLTFIARFARAYPGRTAMLVALLLMAGLAEGFGILTLLPLLELAFSTDRPPSGISATIGGLLERAGIEPRIEVLLLVIVMGMVLKAAFHLLAMKQVGFTVARVATDLRLQLIRSLLDTRWSYFVAQPIGRFANAVGTEVNRASTAYRAICAIAAAGVQALVYAAIAMIVSWRMALFAIAAGALMVLLLSRLVEYSRAAGGSQTQLLKALSSRLTDVLHGIKPIKAMGREHHLQPLLERQTHGINEAQQRQVLASEGLRAAQEPLLVTFLAIALYFILRLGNQTFPAVMLMAFVFYRLAGRIALMQVEYQSIAVGESAFWSLQNTIDEAVDQREPAGAGLPPEFEGAIELVDVSFSYGTRPVLRNISLTIPQGGFVAIVGTSGAGKTTLADLVTGLYAPTSGAVLIDGKSLAELDRRAWRNRIGYVPQETLLFHDTVVQNVTLGDPTISLAAVERALERAGAADFVAELADGLETILGERGSRLSGGQRQRISIARALVNDPKLLILDEATASLDPVTEQAIAATMRGLRGEMTILSISHQPTMTDAADIIYRLENGSVRDAITAA